MLGPLNPVLAPFWCCIGDWWGCGLLESPLKCSHADVLVTPPLAPPSPPLPLLLALATLVNSEGAPTSLAAAADPATVWLVAADEGGADDAWERSDSVAAVEEGVCL